MNAFFYYLMTFVEAGLGAVGIRGLYEQPPYTVVDHRDGFEVRQYPARVAAETDDDRDGGAAFGRLFRYITGANQSGEHIAMTAPVSQRRGDRIAMTVPVQSNPTGGVMRFFLPHDVVASGPPMPSDPKVRLVTVPAERLAVRRFSGIPSASRVSEENEFLLADLAKAGLRPAGAPFLLTYDAPFTLPFLRRNEAAVALAEPGAK